MSSTLFKVQKAATAAARGEDNEEDGSSEGALEPVGLFNLAVNPQSFTQTVENIFDLSFLVKQGHASLTLDCHGLPVVSQMAVGAGSSNADSATDQRSTQMVRMAMLLSSFMHMSLGYVAVVLLSVGPRSPPPLHAPTPFFVCVSR